MTRTYNRPNLLKRHPQYLARLNNRCQFSGFKASKKSHYRFHHTDSKAYGRERPGWNYVLLTPWGHWFAHFLGGVIVQGNGTRCVTIQNKRAKLLPWSWLWRFPNPLQRLFNWWCRLSWLLRLPLLVGLAAWAVEPVFLQWLIFGC
jgi:hypothetical protein